MNYNTIFFVVFPYVALLTAIIVGIYRYYSDAFSYSALSSQFLESNNLFWGSVPFHWGITLILIAHLLAALFPQVWIHVISGSTRIYVVEITGLALGLLTFIGIVVLMLRRLFKPRIQKVSSTMDWVLLLALLIQVGTGISIALTYRWGSLWYAHTAAPWLWSLVYLNPQVHYLAPLPWIVKFHIVNAFFILFLFPFTRLVHIVTLPVEYLWRPYQLVKWNRKNRTI